MGDLETGNKGGPEKIKKRPEGTKDRKELMDHCSVDQKSVAILKDALERSGQSRMLDLLLRSGKGYAVFNTSFSMKKFLRDWKDDVDNCIKSELTTMIDFNDKMSTAFMTYVQVFSNKNYSNLSASELAKGDLKNLSLAYDFLHSAYDQFSPIYDNAKFKAIPTFAITANLTEDEREYVKDFFMKKEKSNFWKEFLGNREILHRAVIKREQQK